MPTKWALLSLFLVQGFRPPGPTTHSPANRDFPSPFKKPPKGGLTRARLVSVEGVSELRRCFGAFISARKIPFPGNGDRGSQRPVRYQRLLGQSAGGPFRPLCLCP